MALSSWYNISLHLHPTVRSHSLTESNPPLVHITSDPLDFQRTFTRNCNHETPVKHSIPRIPSKIIKFVLRPAELGHDPAIGRKSTNRRTNDDQNSPLFHHMSNTQEASENRIFGPVLAISTLYSDTHLAIAFIQNFLFCLRFVFVSIFVFSIHFLADHRSRRSNLHWEKQRKRESSSSPCNEQRTHQIHHIHTQSDRTSMQQPQQQHVKWWTRDRRTMQQHSIQVQRQGNRKRDQIFGISGHHTQRMRPNNVTWRVTRRCRVMHAKRPQKARNISHFSKKGRAKKFYPLYYASPIVF